MNAEAIIRHNSKILTPLALLLALAGCAQRATKAAAPAAAVPVVIAPVELKTVPLSVRSIGNVQAYQSVAIKSMVNAQIMEVHFKQGEDVTQGQLLYQLDPRQAEADLKRAENNLLHDEATAKNNRVQADRYASLLKEGVVAKQDYDQFLTTSQAADAGVEADKQAVEAAKVQLQYTKIYSPISGRAGDFLIDKGNVVKANDTPSLVTINQISPIYVNFSIPEQQLADVKSIPRPARLKCKPSSPVTSPIRPMASSPSSIMPSTPPPVPSSSKARSRTKTDVSGRVNSLTWC